jgi:hypothetical protein
MDHRRQLNTVKLCSFKIQDRFIADLMTTTFLLFENISNIEMTPLQLGLKTYIMEYYDFRNKKILGSLLLVVFRRAHVLFTSFVFVSVWWRLTTPTV